MYFWLCERLCFIKLVWVALGFLRAPDIIKHLVKSFSTVELTAAGKPLEIAIVAGSIIFLLAFRMATEGIIRTLKRVGGGEMPRGRICLPPIRIYLSDSGTPSRKKVACQSEWKPELQAVVKGRRSYFKELLRRLKSFYVGDVGLCFADDLKRWFPTWGSGPSQGAERWLTGRQVEVILKLECRAFVSPFWRCMRQCRSCNYSEPVNEHQDWNTRCKRDFSVWQTWSFVHFDSLKLMEVVECEKTNCDFCLQHFSLQNVYFIAL